MHAERDSLRSKWASTVNEFKNSGLTQADFCRNNNLKFKQFNYWFRKFKSEDHSIVKPKPQPKKQSLQWVKLERNEVLQQNPGNNSSSTLNLKIGDVTIEVKNGYNSSLLAQVIDTLRPIC